jgi:hypothetical protein
MRLNCLIITLVIPVFLAKFLLGWSYRLTVDALIIPTLAQDRHNTYQLAVRLIQRLKDYQLFLYHSMG